MERLGMKKGESKAGGSPLKKGRKRLSPVSVFWLCLFCLLFVGIVGPGLDSFSSTNVSRHRLDVCHGKQVYMYQLPLEFNVLVIDKNKCDHSLIRWMNLCPRFSNGGYGLQLQNSSTHDPKNDFVLSSWYDTDSYMLEMIFHSRMQKYQCLTQDPSKADAFFIPYYAGLLALAQLYERTNISLTFEKRKLVGLELINWLQDKGGLQWKRYGGRDHFLVLGRTAWDFTAFKVWGTGFNNLPFVGNMTSLIMERDPYRKHQQAVPYPTSFHPDSPQILRKWIKTVENSKRSHLFSYIGAPRPQGRVKTVRGLIGSSCIDAGVSMCNFVNCSMVKCSHDPESVYTAFLASNFCLQPRGDTSTRRSTFDCLISGTIPVFFHNNSAYLQYTWHLPKDPGSYSVLIPEEDVMKGVSIQKHLLSYSPERVLKMRRTILSIIPNLIYNNYDNDPWSGRKDAFELSVERVISRIAHEKRQMKTSF